MSTNTEKAKAAMNSGFVDHSVISDTDLASLCHSNKGERFVRCIDRLRGNGTYDDTSHTKYCGCDE